MTDVGRQAQWRPAEAGGGQGQNRSNDDLMMVAGNFAPRHIWRSYISPLRPLELQIGPRGFGQNDVTLNNSQRFVWSMRLCTIYIG